MIRLNTTAALAVLAATLSVTGCASTLQDRHDEWTDPCWPERYDKQARDSVRETFASQVANGREVDQALYNYHFESGTAELSPAGRAKIDNLVRRRPNVDTKLALQTARDVSYDPTKPDALVNSRADLDTKRIASIQQYTLASTSGRSVAFDVTVKDLPDLSIDSAGPANSVRGLPLQYGSTLLGAAGGIIQGAGGAAAPVGGAAAGGVPAGGGGGQPIR